jgi:hypothetical protein
MFSKIRKSPTVLRDNNGVLAFFDTAVAVSVE